MEFRPTRRRRAEPTLDLTPLIDVVFLLLVFFLVTATFATSTEQSSVPVDLPEGTTGEASSAAERVTVHLEATGAVTIELPGAPIERSSELSAIRAKLAEAFAREPGVPVYLRGDREVPYGRVMEVLDAARAAGFTQVYNVVESSAP
jgi:biopolymer transport protein ExbD